MCTHCGVKFIMYIYIPYAFDVWKNMTIVFRKTKLKLKKFI